MGMEYVEQPTEHPAPTTPPKKRAREATTLKNIKIAAYANVSATLLYFIGKNMFFDPKF